MNFLQEVRKQTHTQVFVNTHCLTQKHSYRDLGVGPEGEGGRGGEPERAPPSSRLVRLERRDRAWMVASFMVPFLQVQTNCRKGDTLIYK